MRNLLFVPLIALMLCSCATRVNEHQPPSFASAPNAAYAEHGMVACVHPLAARAGVNVLKNGGNAIDAAVAVGLTLGVVDGPNSGIGGGCFLLIRRVDGSVVALDGREMAPAAATRDMYVRDGRADTRLSQNGPLAIGVPGALAVYEHAAREFGRKPLRELILPAAQIAEDGFSISRAYSAKIRSQVDNLKKYEASRALLLDSEGEPLPAGATLKQPDLARTYRGIAEQGSDWFYRGPFANAVAKWMPVHGGIITAEDFANYQPRVREPIRSTYRGFEIVSFPPPSSGGVHVAEILNILEHFDMKSLGVATREHVLVETMKLAFADRAHWLGDADFAPVPLGLLDKQYAAELAGRIHLDRATRVPTHGYPPQWDERLFERHTTHFSVADAEGNWVACTATINTSFGSKVVVPGTGVFLNNEMDDFSAQPGVPNAFGLIGAEANAVEPGKRPLSSMSPTIVLKEGRPFMALGAAGGPTIITQVLQHLVNILDLNMNPVEAIAAPRLHHQWFPDEVRVERGMSENLQRMLEDRGHTLRVVGSMGASQIVMRAPNGAGFVGVGEPRVNGVAAGW